MSAIYSDSSFRKSLSDLKECATKFASKYDRDVYAVAICGEVEILTLQALEVVV